MAFVHLRTHTEFSVVDGTLRIDGLVEAAAADGQGALAITDVSNLFGAVKFYSAARAAGVKPIIGAEVVMEPEAGDKGSSRLVLLAQNRAGYLALCDLLSRGWLENASSGHACVRWDWLRERSEGLLVLSGADGGGLGQALLAGDTVRARAVAERLRAWFPRRFYIEVQRIGLPSNEAHLRAAVELAASLELPVVATHTVQFQAADDHEAHEARVCVAEGEMLANPKRIKRFTREQYFKTQAEMEA
ncbi:MAG: PHP domain-containing protein, partial [Caldimonas sp.]